MVKNLKHYFAGLKRLHVSRKQWLMAGGALAPLFCVFGIWATFAMQVLAYNYGLEKTCVTSPRFLPGLSKLRHSNAFRMSRPPSISIGKVALYAHRICVQSQAVPKARASYIHKEELFGSRLLVRQVTVTTPQYPHLAHPVTKKTMRPDGILSLDLSTADQTFTYALASKSAVSPCNSNSTRGNLQCDLTELGLGYAQTYELSLVRMYEGKRLVTMANIPILTITPTTITATSIAAGSTVQEKPNQILLSTDKPLKRLGEVQLVATQSDGKESIVPTATSFAGTQVAVKIEQELARKSSFELRLTELEATDGSGLVSKTFALPFATSGGPRVKGAGIGTRNVALHPAVTVTFDQALLASQPIASTVAMTVNGVGVPVSLGISGEKLTIKPADAMPLCASLTITLNNGVQNRFGISGDSAWNIKARTICYTTFSIGSSVRGRPLTAYRFGNGPQMIIYMGAMHGSEANSKRLMDEWFSEVNARPERIPAHRSIVIIPSVNPDGVAAGTRFNGREVDLNRNFPANDWKSVVTTPDSSEPTPAGGASPLSEPESQALATFIRQNAPRLVLSFHSKAAIVEANEAGDSVSIAGAYASRARFAAVPKSQSAPIFKYDTTGAMEDWMRDKLGRPAIVVELASSSSSEFGRNRDALWYTVAL